MSIPQPSQPAKLGIGVLVRGRSLLEPVVAELRGRYGAIDMISPWYPFDYTDYYGAEMGAPLYRRILFFRDPIEQTLLPEIKLQTNDIETRFHVNGKRSVNLDPGYLLLERFVLATGKNYTHRIYLDKGIYADLTLVFQNGAYQPLPWTYPDYRSSELRAFLLKARSLYCRDAVQGERM